jgi:glycosyltransferase involved in cell wall biosynthesis
MINKLMNRKHKLSVIVPIFKGEKFIRKNLTEMRDSFSKMFDDFEIIAVVDGILDKSFEEAKKVQGIRVEGYEKNKGKGRALKFGYRFVTGDVVTFIDSDMDLHPKLLKNFLPYLTTADMIIGSKRHPFSKLDYPFIRKIFSKGYQLFSYLLLGVHLRDTQSGIKLIKKEVLDVIMPLLMVKQYAFDLELCFLAQKHGFRVVEAPISITYKFSGSGININSVWNMFVDTLAIRYRYSILHYYQKRFHEERFK